MTYSGRFRLTNAGYNLLCKVLPHLMDKGTFTPQDVRDILGHPVGGSIFFGLRNSNVIELVNGGTRRHHTNSGKQEPYRFSSSFLGFLQTQRGKEYFGLVDV